MDKPGESKSATQTELDGLVVNIELTLISIIQGVALYFLTENAHGLLSGLQFAYWPYVATGLLTILIFWSRSLLHVLTVIRWPMELAHNFMYIACTLAEAVTFTQIANIKGWYACYAVFALLIWLLFLLDLRIIRRRIQDSPCLTGDQLYQIVQKDQLFNIRLMVPGIILFNLAATAALYFWPELFLQRGWHLAIALIQMAAAWGYLVYGIRLFIKIAPMIRPTRQEWKG